MTKDILLCGHKSFVATGFAEVLEQTGQTFDCFSRGENKRDGKIVSGSVMDMTSNKELGQYDTVINFIILKNRTIEENIEYIKSLLLFCKDRGVKNLIQISSISVYPNTAEVINEDSAIEENYHNKGGYASIKVAVDHYLMDNPIEGMKVSFVRPGFIYAKNYEISKTGIVFSKFGLNILLGNQHTTLPLISREKIHNALIKIVQSTEKKDTYLLLNPNKEDSTKYNFASRQWNVRPICLPKSPLLFTAKILKYTGIFKERHYQKVLGVFKNTWFDSRKTEKSLGMTFGKRRFAVLGAGTYGSYVSNLLSLIYPHEDITLFDVGDEHLKDEEGIGYLSHCVGAKYEGLQKGRFFGYGGASNKWGGQLLTFGDNDFKHPDRYLKELVEINKKYKDIIYSRFKLENKIPDEVIDQNLTTKTGIWLSYFHRNLFKHFGIIKNRKIHLKPNSRVCKLLLDGKKITGFEYIHKGQKQLACGYDNYFLTAGAFECGRILINSGLGSKENLLPFSDHLSQRAFLVSSDPKMGKYDFTFHVQGASLVTKRFIGEVDGYSFFSQPINNEDFPFFQDLKKLLFGHYFSFGLFWDILKNVPHCIAFAWCMFIEKRLYVYKNQFYLQIDIEAPHDSGVMNLNDERDRFGEKSLDVNLSIKEKTGELFTKARLQLKEFLDANGVLYKELPFSTSAEKYEDTYHPFGIYSDYKTLDEYFYNFENMLVVNTGVMPRAGGINNTAAGFPLIEEYINCIMK